jgi:hypothetical protein
MTNDQKAVMVGYVRAIQRELQTLADEPNTNYERMNARREHADWQMVHILREITSVLPKDLRADVQACLSINDHLWSAEYSQACFRAQKEKTSPESLAIAG